MVAACEVQQPPSWTWALRECDVIGSGGYEVNSKSWVLIALIFPTGGEEVSSTFQGTKGRD